MSEEIKKKIREFSQAQKEPVLLARLEKDINGNPFLVKSEFGEFLISEKPIDGHEYVMGTHVVPMNCSEESANCTLIKDLNTNSYVCLLVDYNHSDLNLFYEKVTAVQKIYNNCENLIERNSAQLFYDLCKEDNNLKSLAFQPTWIGAKGYVKNTVRGVYLTVKHDEPTNLVLEYIKEHYDKINFTLIQEQLKSFGLIETVTINAMKLCEILSKEHQNKTKQKL